MVLCMPRIFSMVVRMVLHNGAYGAAYAVYGGVHGAHGVFFLNRTYVQAARATPRHTRLETDQHCRVRQ